MIKFKQKGDFKKTESFFKKIGKGDIFKGLEKIPYIIIKNLK